MKWATLLIGLFVAANGHEDSEDPDHTHGKNAKILPKNLSPPQSQFWYSRNFL